MKQEVMKQWVKALRSGEYKQGRSSLRNKDHFCCLGVLCDLHSKTDGHRATWSVPDFCGDMKYGAIDKNETELPASVMRWAGMHSPNPVLEFSSLAEPVLEFPSLAELNDNGRTFGEIADLIEKNWCGM
jgi:hypothetical protein